MEKELGLFDWLKDKLSGRDRKMEDLSAKAGDSMWDRRELEDYILETQFPEKWETYTGNPSELSRGLMLYEAGMRDSNPYENPDDLPGQLGSPSTERLPAQEVHLPGSVMEGRRAIEHGRVAGADNAQLLRRMGLKTR